MAKDAIHIASLEGKPSPSVVTAIFERRLAEQGLRCTCRQAAIDAAFLGLDSARRDFDEQVAEGKRAFRAKGMT